MWATDPIITKIELAYTAISNRNQFERVARTLAIKLEGNSNGSAVRRPRCPGLESSIAFGDGREHAVTTSVCIGEAYLAIAPLRIAARVYKLTAIRRKADGGINVRGQ